jgi:hypothetical protein
MADEVQQGLTEQEKALANALIETATQHEVSDAEVASASAALLAGAIAGMLGLGGEDTSPEEYNQFTGYFHTRIEEFVLSLIAEASQPAQDGN